MLSNLFDQIFSHGRKLCVRIIFYLLDIIIVQSSMVLNIIDEFFGQDLDSFFQDQNQQIQLLKLITDILLFHNFLFRYVAELQLQYIYQTIRGSINWPSKK